MAEWLRTLIFITLNRSSSHRCGFEHSWGPMWDKARCFFSGISHFRPTLQLTWLKMSEIILTGCKIQIKKTKINSNEFLAHLSRRLIWWAYRIGRPLSSVFVRRRPHSLNIFSSETTGPVKVKFHMELLWDGGTKVCSNVPGHMTKMAAMPIYGQKP